MVFREFRQAVGGQGAIRETSNKQLFVSSGRKVERDT